MKQAVAVFHEKSRVAEVLRLMGILDIVKYLLSTYAFNWKGFEEN